MAGSSSPAPHSVHHLPEHLLLRCLEPLGHRDLLRAASVSREWAAVARCEGLWRLRFQEDFRPSEALVQSRSGSSSLGCPAARPFAAAEQGLAQLEPKSGVRWREAYLQRLLTEANWLDGRCAWGRLDGHRDYIRCAQLQGSMLATCSGSYMQRDCSIRLWNVESSACLEHMRGHGSPIWSMHYDGARVASCDDEGGVRLWDLSSHRVGVSAALAPHSLKCVGLDARQLAVCGETGVLALWSLRDVQRALEDADPPAGSDKQMADEAAAADDDDDDEEEEEEEGRLPAWHAVALDGADGARPSRGRAPQAPGAGLPADTSCLQVEAGLCATGEGGGEGQVHLWGTQDDELEYRCAMPGHARGVSTLSFQVETGQLVAGTGAGPVKVWSLERAALVHDLRGHSADVLCHQQSGAQLATGAADRSARLWDLRCGRLQHTVPLGAFPYSLQMDDRRLVVGCSNGEVQVVDLRGRGTVPGNDELHVQSVPPAHRERVWALAMDGSRLVSASLDSTIMVRSFADADVARVRGSWLDRRDDMEASTNEAGSDAELDTDGSDGSGSDWESADEEAGEEDEEADADEGGAWPA